jgi:hypothetical protein
MSWITKEGKFNENPGEIWKTLSLPFLDPILSNQPKDSQTNQTSKSTKRETSQLITYKPIQIELI